MGTLILNILIQYGVIGFICAAVVDFIIRTTKSSEPFTLMEILGTIIAWPIVIGALLTSVFEDFFN
jgi:uncharacterized membrane protein YeiB